MDSLDILDRLIGFPTVSLTSNHELMGFVRGLLTDAGVDMIAVESRHAGNLNLFATIGPADRAGVVLSGHTDVVPTEGQAWTVDPFQMTRRDGRLYGRGTADMKGFVACAVRAAMLAARRELAIPLHLALSCDEEVGCVGVRPLLDALAARRLHPVACIIGEPTSMRLATGHKGKIALQVVCQGRAGHSALAPRMLNATALTAVTPARSQQSAIPERKLVDPSARTPTSIAILGQGNPARGSSHAAEAVTIFCTDVAAKKISSVDA